MVRGAVVWVLDTCVVVLYVMCGGGRFRVRICKSPRCCVACGRLPVRTRKQEIGEKREKNGKKKSSGKRFISLVLEHNT